MNDKQMTMKTYLVGGAVRDKLLNIPVKDKDWVVVGSNPDDMKARGFLQVGKDFPVFIHPETKQEYALARTERKTAPGHGGFEFDTSKQVSLEQDLQRRDLTINAIAETEQGELIDPYNGQQDLSLKILRHVSPAFAEDPLRVLRVAKFAARLAHLGFKVADETMDLMRNIVTSGELHSLVKERVWQELEQAMSSKEPAVFIKVLRECGALLVILPEVDQLFGVPQPKKYHPEVDTGIHILMCLDQAAKLSSNPVVRYATLVHDVGKGITDKSKWPSHHAHETLGLKLQKQITARLHVPNEFSRMAALVCEHHTKLHRIKELRPATLLKLLESLDAFRRPERLELFLCACEADSKGRTGFENHDYPQGKYLTDVLASLSSLDIGAEIKNANPNNIQSFVFEHRLIIITESVRQLNVSSN